MTATKLDPVVHIALTVSPVFNIIFSSPVQIYDSSAGMIRFLINVLALLAEPELGYAYSVMVAISLDILQKMIDKIARFSAASAMHSTVSVFPSNVFIKDMITSLTKN